MYPGSLRLFIYISLLINILSIVYAQFDLKIVLLSMGFSHKDFGKYEIRTRFIGECSSPGYTNKKNTLDYKTIVTKTENGEEITGYAYVKQTHKVIKATFNPQLWRNGSFKSVFNWMSEKPCIDPIMSLPLLLTYHTDTSCIIKKGNYTIQGLFPDKIAHKIIGETCIHCRIRVILKYFSKLGCTYCTELIIDVF